MTLRWFSLRLLFSLVFLPGVAIGTLALLHGVVFPGVYFQDAPVIVILFIVLFALTELVITRIGTSRFQQLNQAGWVFFQGNDERRLAEIFSGLDGLFQGGLLSRQRSRNLKNLLLRRYFNFYLQNIEESRYRDELIECLRRDIRAQDAYQALRAYLLQQAHLTLATIDLAETLHEFVPGDPTIPTFMAERYLQDRQIHYRAEYFYQKQLESASTLEEKIIQLCLPRIYDSHRLDDFAGWLACRAYESADGERWPRLAYQLFRFAQFFTATGRNDDALAQRIFAVVKGFSADDLARWQAEAAAKQQKQIPARVARATYFAQQKLVLLWGEIKRYRQYVYYGVAGVALLFVIYLILPAKQEKVEPTAASVQAVESEPKVFFSLQVSATKSLRSAENEVARLRQAELDAYISRPGQRGGWYKVRVGKFATRQEAQQTAESLKKAKIIQEFFLVNYSREEN